MKETFMQKHKCALVLLVRSEMQCGRHLKDTGENVNVTTTTTNYMSMACTSSIHLKLQARY